MLREYDCLITVDSVCRSIPSPLLWKEYLNWWETKVKSKIKYINCREKTYGYHSGSLVIEFENSKIYSGSNRVDPYMKCFHHNVCSRPSCYACKFKTKTRCSDFTVFDSWQPALVTNGPLQDNNKGYSNIIVHTGRGRKIIEQIENNLLVPAEANRMFLYTGGMELNSVKWSERRAKFYADLNYYGFDYVVKQSVHISLMDQMIEKIKPVYYFLKKIRNF